MSNSETLEVWHSKIRRGGWRVEQERVTIYQCHCEDNQVSKKCQAIPGELARKDSEDVLKKKVLNPFYTSQKAGNIADICIYTYPSIHIVSDYSKSLHRNTMIKSNNKRIICYLLSYQKSTKQHQVGVESVKRGELFLSSMVDLQKRKRFWVQMHPMMQKVLQNNNAMKLELFLLGFIDIVLEKKYRKLIL